MPERRALPGLRLVAGLVAAALAIMVLLRAARVPYPPSIAPPDTRIDVNAASAAELCILPGIGPRLADRIVASRAAAGPFERLDGLARVPGIGPAIVERVRPYAVTGDG